MDTREIQNIMAQILSKKVYLPEVSPDKIIINSTVPNSQYKISIRLGKNYRVLPTPEQVIDEYNKTGKKGEGAPWILFGMIQVVGNKVRVTTRIIRTETSEVVRSGSGDGEFTTEGLAEAFQNALVKLNINYVC